MHPPRLRRCLTSPALLVLLGAFAFGCAPSEEESFDEGDQATTLGSRWRSPLDVGDYDGRNMSLSIVAWSDRQRVKVINQNLDVCYETVDVTNGRAKIDGGDCTLNLTDDAKGIAAAGRTRLGPLNEVFKRRPKNALVGTYVTDGRAELVVEASSADQIQLTVRGGGRTYASHAKARREGVQVTGHFFNWYASDAFPQCTFTVGRENGRFTVTIVRSGQSACPVEGIALPR